MEGFAGVGRSDGISGEKDGDLRAEFEIVPEGERDRLMIGWRVLVPSRD